MNYFIIFTLHKSSICTINLSFFILFVEFYFCLYLSQHDAFEKDTMARDFILVGHDVFTLDTDTDLQNRNRKLVDVFFT